MLPKCEYRGFFLDNKKYECFHSDVKNYDVSVGFCQNCPLAEFAGRGTAKQLTEPHPIEPLPESAKHKENNKKIRTMPNIVQLGWNFALAVSKHILDNSEKCTKEEYEKRLKICDTCSSRSNNRCSEMNCGCLLEVKASWKSEKCPRNKWS